MNIESEFRIQGRAVSRGIAIGRVVCLHGTKRQFFRLNLTENQVVNEVSRLETAFNLAISQLIKIGKVQNETQSKIFETHRLILEDSTLIEKIIFIITDQNVNAEWAIKQVTESYLSIYKTFKNEHLKERQNDFEDVMERLLISLGGGETQISLEKNSIIVAKDVKPSTLVELSKFNLKGIITENGGWTSHTFILAREQNLPAITSAKSIRRQLKTGDVVIIDGFNGIIIAHPKSSTIDFYQNKQNHNTLTYESNFIDLKGKLKTLDGREISIFANLENADGFKEAKKLGAEGIGLFRSEHLFNQNHSIPVEDEQFLAYQKIAKAVGQDGVKIRTFDLSIENVSNESEENPALGLRAIRLAFTNIDSFRVQIRALLRASVGKKIEILLPMVSDISEILQTREIIESERKILETKGLNIDFPKLGVMIEVPSAVLMVDEIAQEVDFMCLGTNDLVQYLLAVDRDNEAVENWFRTLHPAVLKSIKKVINASEKAGIATIVCGEMAGSPVYATILVGLGVTNLSMNYKSIPRIRQIISQIAFEEAHIVVKKLETCKTSFEVESQVSQLFIEKWSHLFPKEHLPVAKS